MKINPNVLAATILGASIIVAMIIYATAPQSGRYTYKYKNDDGFLEESVFDSATGTRYCYSLITSTPKAHSSYSVFALKDYKKLAQRQSATEK